VLTAQIKGTELLDVLRVRLGASAIVATSIYCCIRLFIVASVDEWHQALLPARADRLHDALAFFSAERSESMHDTVAQTGAWLRGVMQGHFNYYVVTGNGTALASSDNG
jgi:hypothetical protein